MSQFGHDNPYEVLRLVTTASLAEVIRRSRELCDETMDRELQTKYRRAAEEIRQHPVNRALCQFWEPPDTGYGDSSEADQKQIVARKLFLIARDATVASDTQETADTQHGN